MSQEANDKLDRERAKAAFSMVREKVSDHGIIQALIQNPEDDEREGVVMLHEGENIVPEEHIEPGWNTVKVPLSVGGEVRIYVGETPFNSLTQKEEGPDLDGQKIYE